MKKGMISTVIEHRRVTLFIVILILIAGIYNFYITPKQEYPNITAPFALITTVYPGASPEDVAQLVTSKIEDELVEIEGYSYSRSYSKNSLSIVTLRLDDKVDVEETWKELRQRMSDLQRELPQQSQDINVNTDLADTAGVIMSLSGEGYSYEQLADYGEGFKQELSKIRGISRVDLLGKQEQEVVVEVAIEKLNYHGLALSDVIELIRAQNVEIPSGIINDGGTKINVTVPGSLQSIEDIENIVLDISPDTGAFLRLRDIANVHMAIEESTYKIKQDGENAVLVTGYFRENENVVLIGKEVDERIATLKDRLPPDIIVDEVVYHPRDIDEAVNSFLFNLIVGIALVMLIVFIGMGWRNALIVSSAIPLSILTAFSVMNLFGIKIHQISIAALIIALGMLVDNAIVISDSIQVHIDKGEEKIKACSIGAREVAVPIFTSTLTTIAAFIPLIMLPSVAGEYIRSIPQVVIITLIASYLVAIFVVPSLAYLFLKESQVKDRKTRTRMLFTNILNQALDRRRYSMIILGVFFALAIYVTSLLGLQFFPKADTNILYIDINSEKLMNIEETERIVEAVTTILEEQQEVVGTTAAIGDGLPKFYNTLPAPIQSQDYAQIMVTVDLREGNRFRNNGQLADFIQQEIDGNIAGGTAIVKLLEQGEPIGAPVIIRITGEDMDRILGVTEEVKALLAGIGGTINIQDDHENNIYEYVVEADGDRASMLGITNYDIQNEINIALMGREAFFLREGGNEHRVVVKGNIQSKEDLENFAIASSFSDNKVLLKQLGSVSLASQLPTIKKYNREVAVTIQSDVRSGYSSVEIQRSVENQLEGMDLTDVEVVFDGEREKIMEYFGNIGISAIFAVALIYLVLLLQFGSLAQPLVILLTIPLSAIGSVIGLFLLRQPLSFTSLLGIVSLFGIVVNNAIVLMDFINNERKKGKEVKDACRDAVEKRFRPIMLTTVTTIAGLLPLAFGQNELFVPMSISLIAGLLVSTVLTLVIIPVVYSLVEGKVSASES